VVPEASARGHPNAVARLTSPKAKISVDEIEE
jgi:hypothetical protein